MSEISKKKTESKDSLVLFKEQTIGRTWHEGGALTESASARRYWSDLKRQLIEKEAFHELYEKIVPFKLLSADGKIRETDCANTESLLRIIQSVPSPKAESFKRWLAKVGYERIQEIENPELSQERMKKLYEEKGYPKEWIEKRLRGIAIRQDLTDEWKERGIIHQKDYAILTSEISKATFPDFCQIPK